MRCVHVETSSRSNQTSAAFVKRSPAGVLRGQPKSGLNETSRMLDIMLNDMTLHLSKTAMSTSISHSTALHKTTLIYAYK